MSFPRPLVRRDQCEEPPYRTVKFHNDFILYPEAWPPYYNGNEPCDMLQGPCACGAWHSLTEWEINNG